METLLHEVREEIEVLYVERGHDCATTPQCKELLKRERRLIHAVKPWV